jgi:voltage-gated potassium channel
MSNSQAVRRILAGIVVFAAVCVAAVVGYLIAGWPLVDAVYMVIITIFGVGYGEVQPVQSWALRGLTMAVIVVGYGAVIYTIGGFIQMVVDGELNEALGKRRMLRDIEALHGHTIICGMGRMGRRLANELDAAGKPFVAVDADPTTVTEMEAAGHLVLRGDATDEDLLDRAGIRRASSLASALSDDAANVFVTITARAMKPDLLIVARAEDPRTEPKLVGSGADTVVLPTTIGASKMSQLILRPSAEDFLDRLTTDGDLGTVVDVFSLGLEFDQIEISDGSTLAGRAIDQMTVRGAHGYLVVGVRRANGETLLHPPAETTLEVGDTVVVLAYEDDSLEVAPLRSNTTRRITYRGTTTTLPDES